jgi:hypothetical protein
MAPQSGSGGFLRSAMMTAAGVAGGMLAAGAISNMLGGNQAHANNTPAAGAQTPNNDAAVQQARQDWEQDMRQDAQDDDTDYGGGDGDL